MKSLFQQLDAVLGGLPTAPEGLTEPVTYTPASTGAALASVPCVVNHEQPDIRGAAETPVQRDDGFLRRASIAVLVRTADVAAPDADDLLVRSDGSKWVATDVLQRSPVHALLRFVCLTPVERSRKEFRLGG